MARVLRVGIEGALASGHLLGWPATPDNQPPCPVVGCRQPAKAAHVPPPKMCSPGPLPEPKSQANRDGTPLIPGTITKPGSRVGTDHWPRWRSPDLYGAPPGLLGKRCDRPRRPGANSAAGRKTALNGSTLRRFPLSRPVCLRGCRPLLGDLGLWDAPGMRARAGLPNACGRRASALPLPSAIRSGARLRLNSNDNQGLRTCLRAKRSSGPW